MSLALNINDLLDRPGYAVNRWKVIKDVTALFNNAQTKAGQKAFVCESVNHEGATPMKRVVWTADNKFVKMV